MTRGEFEFFLLGSSALCLLMAIFNAIRGRSRGTSSYLLSGAFLCVALALMLYRSGTDTAFVTIVGALAFALLVGDFMVRAKTQVLNGEEK